ncbi:recombinase family protein [Bacillus solimangrovi]|uniref:Cassette chromosome recombinase B n=1 Tax=Bacillus solimangrovi TaxID=1305675 RepID=A0A1E5LER8_9BACI|nr:recombinase family protein [Bacillus solimangrovi]OEH92571.1 cassette chromosome recombinase B [Bacillus solimangrovi]
MPLSKVLKPGMKAVFYGRHSTDKQEMMMQRNSVENLVQKYGCKITNEYLDSGVSATKTNIAQRKALSKLLNAADNQQFDFVAIYSSDRLARNPIEHQQIRMTMRLYGIPIIESRSERLYDTEEDELIVQLLYDGLSKFEADNIKTRTRDGLISRAKHGHWTGGKAPYGYRYDKQKHRFITFPEELVIVKEIYDLYMKAEGFNSIAKQLPKESNHGKQWTKDKVKAIVTNPFYAGYISWGKRKPNAKGTFIDRESWILIKSSYIEPVIAEEQWEHCWQLYMNKRNRKITPKHFKTSFLLKGLVLCKHCQKPLQTKDQRTSGSNGKKYGSKIYKCSSCSVRVDADELHENVLTQVLNDIRLSNPEKIQQGVVNSINRDILKLEDDIKGLESALGNYEVQANQLHNELQQRMKADISERSKKLMDVITIYRVNLNNRIELTKHLIKEKMKEITELKQNQLNSQSLQLALNSALQDQDNLENSDIRRLLVQLVEKIEINKEQKVSYTLRNDLKRKEITNQMEFLF